MQSLAPATASIAESGSTAITEITEIAKIASQGGSFGFPFTEQVQPANHLAMLSGDEQLNQALVTTLHICTIAASALSACVYLLFGSNLLPKNG